MTVPPDATHRYRVLVDDNYHYMDEGERYELGEFDSCESAVAACKRIIDGFLVDVDLSSRTAESLWEGYLAFGDDPFIVTDDESCSFSAWDYARRRCEELAQEPPSAPQP